MKLKSGKKPVTEPRRKIQVVTKLRPFERGVAATCYSDQRVPLPRSQVLFVLMWSMQLPVIFVIFLSEIKLVARQQPCIIITLGKD